MIRFSKESADTCLFIKNKETKILQVKKKKRKENQYFGRVADEGGITFQLFYQEMLLIKLPVC